MKKPLLLLLCLLFPAFIFAQKKLFFSYDAAGNQIRRDLICVNCIDTNYTEEEPKNEEIIAENDTEENTEKATPTFSYYPNPTREELYMSWENTVETTLYTVEVYTTKGQRIRTFTDLSRQNQLTIPFSTLPTGIYHVQLLYQDGSRKTVNIIKK